MGTEEKQEDFAHAEGSGKEVEGLVIKTRNLSRDSCCFVVFFYVFFKKTYSSKQAYHNIPSRCRTVPKILDSGCVSPGSIQITARTVCCCGCVLLWRHHGWWRGCSTAAAAARKIVILVSVRGCCRNQTLRCTIHTAYPGRRPNSIAPRASISRRPARRRVHRVTRLPQRSKYVRILRPSISRASCILTIWFKADEELATSGLLWHCRGDGMEGKDVCWRVHAPCLANTTI